MEQIIVNVSRAPCAISLPSGRPILLNPGFAVQGNYFLRFLDPGKLEVLAKIPAGFTVRGVSQPLAGDQSRDNSAASNKVQGKIENKSQPRVAAKTAASALAESGKDATLENLATGIPGAITASQNADEGYMGATAATWIARIQGISNATLAQQLKLNELKGLAKFLGVESELHTKAELVEAVRVKANG